ncbi:MAG: GH36 C-terminal domain-containing protein, partial [Clostridia bacterium]|nr:GH36 C-terminal domain-containing protein [Clostridia bacterium]
PTDEYTAYSDISRYMTENYFPLNYGGTDAGKILAVLFGTADEGAAVIYKREKNANNEYLLKLNGLDESAFYTVTDFDKPNFAVRKSGRELMDAGITLRTKESPAAVIIKYSADK